MKHITRNTILFLMICWSVQAFGQSIEQMGCGVEGCSHRISSLWKSAFVESKNYDQWDLVYNKLELNVDPVVRYISGSVRFEFIANVDQLSMLTIDLSDSLNVDSIKSSNFFPLNFEHIGNTINIELKDTLFKSDHCCFKIYYQGKPNESGFGAFLHGSHNDVPIIATLSEPYGAMEWWPCKQSLQDKIDSIDIIVYTPEKYRTASNGLLMTDSVFDEIRINHWKHRHPIATYLVAFAVTDYEVYSDYAHLSTGDSVEILNYVYPEMLDYAKKETKQTEWMLEFFSERFMDYPFKNEKYGHAQFSWGGGMEHQTMSFMGFFQFEIIAHELAHQWFGDYITCGSWQDIWLNEGFATYLTGLCYEHFSPDYYWPHWKKIAIEKVVKESGGTVFVEDTSSVNRIFSSRLSYYKASLLLHMLRGQLGDSVFFSGIRNYLNDERVTNGFARTHHLIENLELAGDTTLTEFFNDWFYGEGYPIYQYAWGYSEGKINMRVNQVSLDPGGEFFEMNIPISIWTDDKEDKRWLKNTKVIEDYVINVEGEPDSIQFDPDLWLLARWNDMNTGVSNYESDFQCYPNPVSNVLNVSFEAEILRFELLTVNGQVVVSELLNNGHGTIDVSKMRKGVYMAKITKNGKEHIQKLIIK